MHQRLWSKANRLYDVKGLKLGLQVKYELDRHREIYKRELTKQRLKNLSENKEEIKMQS